MEEDNLVDLVIEDKYKLDRKIGEGGMGAVYLGTQLMVDRNVAIKLLHTGLSGHERIKQRFEVEAKAIGRMNHPNCITLFDFGFSSELDAFYMVMEYLDGTPMHRRVVEGVGAQEAVDITRQIAMALDHAHHQGILHRDLKPENVMLTQMTDGSQLVKVLDFGIARIFQDGDEEQKTTQEQNRLTRAGEVFGTPAYISPEQARGDRDLTPSSDLYSLGVMLYEMLQGELPFWGETAIDTIMKHITSPVPRLTRIDIPNDLKELTYTLLDKDPTNRPQSGRELAERLAAISFAPRRQVPVGAMAGGMGGMGAGSIGASLGSNLSQEFPFVPDNGSTIPEMGMSGPELNEWAEAGQTVVQKPGRTGHMTMPPNQPLRPPAVADGSSSDLFIHPGPHTTGEFYTSDIETQSSRPGWLVPVILLLALAMAAGVGFFAFGPTETQANQTDTDPKGSIADKSDPANKVEDPPEVKDKNDAPEKKPVATSAKKPEAKETTPPNKDDKAGIELFEEKKDPTPKDSKRTATKKKTTVKKKRDEPKKKIEKKEDKKEDKTSIPSLSLDRDKDNKKETKSDKPRSIEL